MNVLLVTIPLSLLLLICAVVAFFWAVDHDQFDDMETPGLLPLDDGPGQNPPSREEPQP
jgi:cbb3-type cytochrome oxidase maturation protein